MRFDCYLDIVQHGANGYYGGGRVSFGGDFITAPMVSPLFGAALCRQIGQILHHCGGGGKSGGGGILELGAGDGALARQILGAFDCAYTIVETSPALRERQRQNLAGFSVSWREELPRQFTGAIIANEVLDSVPFRLLRRKDGKWRELGIVIDGGHLAFAARPMIDDADAKNLPPDMPDGYQTEISPRAERLVRRAAETLQCGAAVFLDYGFGAGEYYHRQRSGGTMMCHHRHLADDNPLKMPGEKDITSHIDFSAMAAAAMDGGADVLGYATQAGFLIDCGITEMLAARSDGGAPLPNAKLSAGVQKLLSPSGMGEFIKVLAFGRKMPPLTGFGDNDRRHRL